MTTVLRQEWGFEGCVITDSLDTVSEYYQNPNEAIRAGTDKMLAMVAGDDYWADESAGTVTALRNATHNILFAVANSNAMEKDIGAPTWMKMLIAGDVVVLILLSVWEAVTILRWRRQKPKV